MVLKKINVHQKVISRSGIKSNKEGIIVKRFILKRCFRAWSKETFGRVSPATARKYYDHRILRECVHTWQDIHLHSRKEWKLQIRAEYHDRFRLWQSCFQSWRLFVILRRKSKIVNQKANIHANERVIRRSFSAWIKYGQIQERKKEKQKQADQLSNSYSLRRAWECWLHRFNNERLFKNMGYVALTHWAHITVEKMFLKWKCAYLNRCDVSKKLEYSTAYRNRKLVLQAMNNWKKYMCQRQKKNELKDFANQKHSEKLLNHAFNKWYRSLQHTFHVRDVELNIVTMGEMCIKRRYILLLKNYTLRKQNSQRKWKVAEMKYNEKLEIFALKRLKVYANRSKENERRKNEADTFHHKQILTVCFSKWMVKCEHKEDIKQYPLSKIAYRYYRSKELTKVIFYWLQYMKEKKRTKKLLLLAEIHYARKITPKYLMAWSQFVSLQQNIKEMKQIASGFNRELLYSKYFYTWVKVFQLKDAEDDMNYLAVCHYNVAVLKKTFHCWCGRLTVHTTHISLQEKAEFYHEKVSLRKFFQRWRRRRNQVLDDKQKMSSAVSHYDKHLRRKCWNGLRKYEIRCRKIKCKEIQADTYYCSRRAKKVMVSWKAYACNVRKIKTEADILFEEKSLVLCSWVFTTWTEFVKEQKKHKHLLIKADLHYTIALKRKVFNGLQQYCVTRIRKKFYEDEAVIRAQIKLEKGRMRKIFMNWREDTKEIKSQQEHKVIAVNHWKKAVCVKTFCLWKLHVQHCQRIKILQNLCMFFYTRNVEKRQFTIWKVKHISYVAEGQKSNLSIWWWSYQLQKKVFIALKSYAKYNKEKKQDYRHALNFRKNILLEKGVTLWLQYATHTMNKRREIAHQEQVKKSIAIQARVHKYALLWLQKTQARRKFGGMKLCRDIQYAGTAKRINLEGELMIASANSEDHFQSQSTVSASHNRFKAFDVNFPCPKQRPAPRLPDYLRESFDILNLRYEYQKSQHSQVVGASVNGLEVKECNNLRECEFLPRKSKIAPSHHQPVVHPLSRISSESMKLLELTSEDDDVKKTDITVESGLLLPPSSFSIGSRKNLEKNL